MFRPNHVALIIADDGLLALSECHVPLTPLQATHFGFEAESVRAVTALRAAFKAAGVREAEWQDFGPVRVQVFDPDGYRVEAYAWSPGP